MYLTIREVSQNDAAAISLLSIQLGYSISTEKTEQQIIAVNTSPNDIACVAVDEEKVIGWIHIFYMLRLECASYCEIGGLVVDEKYRGKGIGKMLINQAIPWCKEKRCGKLKVRSNIKRTEAHKFYEQAGFNEMKQQKVFEIYL
jgi:GNAT superfamily N-acetyltransferase